MKKIISILSLVFYFTCFCQVGINTNTPAPSAILDINSDTKGVLVPRLTTTNITTLSSTAAEGLIVYDKQKKIFLGWDGTKWQILGNVVIANTQSFAAWEVLLYSNYGPSPASASSLNTSVVSATLERGSGMTAPSSGAAASAWGGSGWNQADLATAITNNQFAIATLNFVTGKTVSFTKINAHNLRRTNTGPAYSQYQYSIDGGSTYINIGNPINLSSTATTGNNIADIDLTVYYDLQNINTSTISTVKFRIVSYSATGGSGNWYINNITGNDFEITGIIQ